MHKTVLIFTWKQTQAKIRTNKGTLSAFIIGLICIFLKGDNLAKTDSFGTEVHEYVFWAVWYISVNLSIHRKHQSGILRWSVCI